MRAAARWIFPALLILIVFLAVWEAHKRLPPGMAINGAWEPVPDGAIRFLRDQTAADARGQPLVQQQIEPALLQLIGRARAFIVLDAGLFGDLPATGPAAAQLRKAPPLAAELTDALLRRKREQPDLRVLLLLDPSSVLLDAPVAGNGTTVSSLRDAGIDVVAVATDRLRDPNPIGGTLRFLCCDWWAHGGDAGSWPNPTGVGPPSLSFAAWSRLRAYSRSHRQLLLADDGGGRLAGAAFSRSLNAEAGIHSATGLALAGAALAPALEAEFVIAQLSGWTDAGAMQAQARRALAPAGIGAANGISATAGVGSLSGDGSAPAPARARVVSEAAIGSALVTRIEAAPSGAAIDIAALYLAERAVVRALIDAARRGVAVRVLLDPGRDGYGYERSGMPNRQVATELVAASDGAVRIRWYRTHGEQFSTGFALVREGGRSWLMIGTAELSRRDLDNFNLAAAFIVDVDASSITAGEALDWFESLWFNRAPGGTEFSTDADVYADASPIDYWYARLLEAGGGGFD
jgi:hypothetical protein